MTIAELKEIMKDYDDNQFVHMRIWMIHTNGRYGNRYDIIVDKAQQGVDGALLITGNIQVTKFTDVK